jgi:hypothetical protein
MPALGQSRHRPKVLTRPLWADVVEKVLRGEHSDFLKAADAFDAF